MAWRDWRSARGLGFRPCLGARIDRFDTAEGVDTGDWAAIMNGFDILVDLIKNVGVVLIEAGYNTWKVGDAPEI